MVGCLGQGQLEHHFGPCGQGAEMPCERLQKHLLGLSLVCDADRHFRLDNRDQSMAEDLPTHIELLCYDGLDPAGRGSVDNRAHLGAENTRRHGPRAKRIKVRHGLHQLHAVRLVLQPFVDLEKGHNAALFPEILRRRHAADLALHGHFEKDGPQHLVTGELGRLRDAGAHRVDHVEHLRVGAVFAFLHTVEL